MIYFIIAIITLFITGVYQFKKIYNKEKLNSDDYKYMANKLILENKEKRDCYSMTEIQKMQQEIDIYLENKKK